MQRISNVDLFYPLIVWKVLPNVDPIQCRIAAAAVMSMLVPGISCLKEVISMQFMKFMKRLSLLYPGFCTFWQHQQIFEDAIDACHYRVVIIQYALMRHFKGIAIVHPHCCETLYASLFCQTVKSLDK